MGVNYCFLCKCSSGLKSLLFPFSTNFLLRSTDLRFTTSPAIATYTLIKDGVIVFRVLQPLFLLSFATNCTNVFVSVCGLEFLKFLELKGIFNFFSA